MTDPEVFVTVEEYYEVVRWEGDKLEVLGAFGMEITMTRVLVARVDLTKDQPMPYDQLWFVFDEHGKRLEQGTRKEFTARTMVDAWVKKHGERPRRFTVYQDTLTVEEMVEELERIWRGEETAALKVCREPDDQQPPGFVPVPGMPEGTFQPEKQP